MTTDLVSQAAATPSDAIARIGAERALRLTEEYVAVISHELRTPFSAVIYWAQLLQKSPGDRDNVLRAAQAIERSARLQTHLVNDLIDVSRMSVGKMKLSRTELDLDDVIRSWESISRSPCSSTGAAGRCPDQCRVCTGACRVRPRCAVDEAGRNARSVQRNWPRWGTAKSACCWRIA